MPSSTAPLTALLTALVGSPPPPAGGGVMFASASQGRTQLVVPLDTSSVSTPAQMTALRYLLMDAQLLAGGTLSKVLDGPSPNGTAGGRDALGTKALDKALDRALDKVCARVSCDATQAGAPPALLMPTEAAGGGAPAAAKHRGNGQPRPQPAAVSQPARPASAAPAAPSGDGDRGKDKAKHGRKAQDAKPGDKEPRRLPQEDREEGR